MYLKDMYTLNATSYTILGGLSVQPGLSGYDIRKGIQQSIGYFWAESYGQIYPALKRLAEEGLIAPSKARPSGRKRRQTYVITDTGRAALRQWLALPFHNEPPRNEFLLKLFFAGAASTDVAIAHIQDLNERNRRWLLVIETIEASIPPEQPSNPHLPYWMLTLSMGKALTSAALEWGEKTLVALNSREAPVAGTRQPPAMRTRKPSASPRMQTRGRRGSTRSERKVSK
jgi:DNA-binding PadR family transcriptional regulator